MTHLLLSFVKWNFISGEEKKKSKNIAIIDVIQYEIEENKTNVWTKLIAIIFSTKRQPYVPFSFIVNHQHYTNPFVIDIVVVIWCTIPMSFVIQRQC